MEKDRKKKQFTYENRVHLTIIDENGLKFCRMANALIPFSARRCEACPLWNGQCQEVACQYYDLTGPIEIPSKEEMRRTSGMIALGLTGEFPEFIDGQSWPYEALPYEKALQFAAVVHKGAFRKGTNLPYIIHPVEVSMIVLGLLSEKNNLSRWEFEVAAAAALHDVVEDTETTLDDIGQNFNSHIESLVAFESEDKRKEMPPETSWQLRKEEFLNGLSVAPIEAKMIALGDKLSNLRSLAEDIEAMGPKTWEKFNQKNPTAQEWYYRSVGDCLSEFKESRFHQEYQRLLSNVFCNV